MKIGSARNRKSSLQAGISALVLLLSTGMAMPKLTEELREEFLDWKFGMFIHFGIVGPSFAANNGNAVFGDPNRPNAGPQTVPPPDPLASLVGRSVMPFSHEFGLSVQVIQEFMDGASKRNPELLPQDSEIFPLGTEEIR